MQNFSISRGVLAALLCCPLWVSALDLTAENPGPMPMMKRATYNPVVKMRVNASGAEGSQRISKMSLRVKPANKVEELTLYWGDENGKATGEAMLSKGKPDGSGSVRFKISEPAKNGQYLWLSATPSKAAKVGDEVEFSTITASIGNNEFTSEESISQAVGYMVAHGGEEVKQLKGGSRKCGFFRIPGMITTKKGTLLAVFDARYAHGGDLCADIYVAVSRSTDGGLTWSKPAVNLDGGPGGQNGIGDPCILQAAKGRIWVQGLAAHFGGGASLNASKAGFEPHETGQWEMTYSDDDGKSWAKKNVNPTKQIKKKEWTCILAGPGNGVTMKDGTIVFPAQIWQNGSTPRSQSTICYSKDNGKNWAYGAGVGVSSSECQVVELTDGSLMLNCRDEGASGRRVVSVTKDLGAT